MLVVLEVRMVALHAAETMVAMTVIVNVTSDGGRLAGGGGVRTQQNGILIAGESVCNLPPLLQSPICQFSIKGGVFDMSRISS